MLKALHANGRTSGRAHGRHAAAGAVPRRSSVLRVALALLVAACCLRLAAEAWQRSGSRSFLLSAVSVRRARRLSLDSAMFYGVDMPTAPLDAVLTSDVIYGGCCRQLPHVTVSDTMACMRPAAVSEGCASASRCVFHSSSR